MAKQRGLVGHGGTIRILKLHDRIGVEVGPVVHHPVIEIVHPEDPEYGHEQKPAEEPFIADFFEIPQKSDKYTQCDHDPNNNRKGTELPHILVFGKGPHPNVMIQAVDVLDVKFTNAPDPIDMDVHPKGFRVLGGPQHDVPQR